MKKRFSFLVVLMAAVMMLSACGGNGATKETAGNATDGSSEYTFQVGHVVTTDHSYHLGLQRFAELAKEKSDGKINIEIFPSAQLGNERDLVEGLTLGTIDMALSNSANLGAFSKAYQIFDLPFLFRDREHAHQALDSEIGQNALSELGSLGIKGLSNWENGFFSMWNRKHAIVTPEDVKGMKIRANDNPIHIATYQHLGASPITMGWSEVYSAISNGTVDGVAVSIPSMYSAKIHEVAPYLSDSAEFYVTVILMMNQAKFDSLPADIQTALLEAADEAKVFQRETNGKMTEDRINELKESGLQFSEVDREAFKAASWDAIYEKFGDELGKDKIDQITNMQ